MMARWIPVGYKSDPCGSLRLHILVIGLGNIRETIERRLADKAGRAVHVGCCKALVRYW